MKVSMSAVTTMSILCVAFNIANSASASPGAYEAVSEKTRLTKYICNSVPVKSKCFNEMLEMQCHPMRGIGLDLLAALGRRTTGSIKDENGSDRDGDEAAEAEKENANCWIFSSLRARPSLLPSP